ncbi:hypothetical protein FGADI_8484 [Fusarium gaditjirri]|uniref:Uncharacterized protein n=1 Tax=Fusarium gaditjirri TaxID=282569 RepID=A0A8H4T2B9_9HYPO|nr:hypothetical protein FGADI_8484 [Fusarium gaditjirri]
MDQYIIQGSAEHVSSLLPRYGLGCPHYLVCSSGASQTQWYPKRLGFFSSHNPDLIIFYLDTKNICSDCLKIFAPSGFNFWSLLPDPSGGIGKLGNPPRKWLSPSGQAEQFINLLKIGGGVSDPAIVPLPSSPAAMAAWEWIKSQKKPFYIDQLHLAPRWSPINERNALADSAIAWQYGIAMPTPTVEGISAPRDNESTVAKAPKPTSSRYSLSKPKTSVDMVDMPDCNRPRRSQDSQDITGAQAVPLSMKKKADGAVGASKPTSAVEPAAEQSSHGLASSKEQINPPRKERGKYKPAPPSQGESKPVKARGSPRMASPPAPQYTFSATEESQPEREQERPTLVRPVAPLTQPGPAIRRKAVGAISKNSNAAVEITKVNSQEIDSTTKEKADCEGKESDSDFSLLSKPSPKPQILGPKTKSPEEETARIKSKRNRTNQEAHVELEVLERSKKSSKKSPKAKPVGATKEMSALVKTVVQSKRSSSQTTSVSTYTRSWYNHDPFSFDGAMTLSKLSDYKRRARTVNTYAEKAPELPLETLLRETRPLDKSETLQGLKTTKTMERGDPMVNLFSPDAKDRKPSKLPLGSALGMKAVLEAEPSSGKKPKPSSAEGQVKAKSDRTSSTNPIGETMSEWAEKVQKVATKGNTEQSVRLLKDKVSREMKHGGKVIHSRLETKAGRIGTHSKGNSSHTGRQSSTTVVNHDHVHHKKPKKKDDGHKHHKHQTEPDRIPGSKPYPDQPHEHEHDTHGSHGHGSPGEHEQPGEHQQPAENEKPTENEKPAENEQLAAENKQLDEHPADGPNGSSPTDSGQSTPQPVNNSPAPNSPVESNSPETHLQHTGTSSPHPVSSAQDSPNLSPKPDAQDPSFAENTAGVQDRPDTQPTGLTPQPREQNIQGNISGNESPKTEATVPAAITVELASGTSPSDAKPSSSSLNGNRTDSSSTTLSSEPQEATVARSGSTQGYHRQSTAQSAQCAQLQANYTSDPIQGSRGGLDGSGQSSSGNQTPSIPLSELPSRTGFVAGAGMVGAAALAGGLAATNATSSSHSSDEENVYFNGDSEDPAGSWYNEFDRLSGSHQQPEHDNSDIEVAHGAASLTSSGDEQASQHVAGDDNLSELDSLSHYGEAQQDPLSAFDVQEDLHEQRLQSHEGSDNESSHESIVGHAYKQSSEDGEGDEENVQQHDSESLEKSDNGAESDSEDVQSVNADFLEQSDDNEQYDFAQDSHSHLSSHHSGEVEVLTENEDEDQGYDKSSSDHGFDNESDNGDSYQGSIEDSDQSVQDDTEDDLNPESSQEGSGHETDSEEDQGSDEGEESDSDQSPDGSDGSDSQSSHSSEDDPEDSPDGGSDESAEEEQSDLEPDDSEPESEDISESEQETYSDSGGDDNASYSD